MPIPSFAIHELGWFAFQQLCHTILREVLGQTVQSFLDSRDGGRDGAFQGVWSPRGGDVATGAFVVQCKHTSTYGKRLRLSELVDELAKADKLVKAGKCDVYVLMTNAGVAGATETSVQEAFEAVGVKDVRVFGATWINQTIAENPRLRRLVPRLYGLGDLTEILDDRAYRQARAVLDSMRADLNKLVLTSTYGRATEALEHHGFVLLLGAPATGKTTVAAQLALGSADEFDTAVVKLDTSADFQDRWNPEDRQFFWLDDAFGATQIDYSLARAWIAALPRITSAIRGGAKLVLTSRDYVFQSARPYLKPGSFPLFEEAKVVVDVRDLTLGERRQILYNHLRHGQQENEWLRRLQPHLEAAAAHVGFTPELARRLGHPYFTADVAPSSLKSVERFFSKPDTFLRDVMAGLDPDARAALGLIFVHHDWLASPLTLDARSSDLVARLGSTLGGVVGSLESMEGSLVRHLVREGQTGWVFAHPTMSDAYASLMRSPDLLGHLLVGFPLEALLREVTCDDVGIKGALVVTNAHFDIVLDRLAEPLATPFDERWRDESRRAGFLATRCSASFLERWCAKNAEALASLAEPKLMLEACSQNRLVSKLNRLGLLPEPLRSQFAERLVSYCLDGTDHATLWNEELRSVLSADEWTALLIRVREDLLSDLEWLIARCVDGIDLSETDAQSAIEPLTTLTLYLPDLYPGDEYVAERTDVLRELIEDWAAEHDSDDPDSNEVGSETGVKPVEETDHGVTRSVFDDLVDGRRHS